MFLIKREPKKNENIFLNIETVEQTNYIDREARDKILNRLHNVRKGLSVEPLNIKGTKEEGGEKKEEEEEGGEEEETKENDHETKPKKRFTSKQTSIQEGINVVYNDESFSKGKGKDKIKITHKYYKPNQPEFIEKIQKLFDKPIEPFSCDKIQTQIQQKVIVDYLNLYSPYRGLLVYHGIGSGKTCISIAVAEGLKSEKQIIVLVPEALKTNFFKELKKCGDESYRTNQRWAREIVSEKRDAERLSKVLSLTPEYILEKGVWLSSENAENSQRFEDIPILDQEAINQQVDMMIRAKYSVIGYDKMTEKTFAESGGNPFDNCVVIIDEVHNFVCQIASDDEISTRLYQYLMAAQNCKLVFLTGSPIINHPHEIAILFNMLRGYIKAWSIPVIKPSSNSAIKKLFSKNDFKLWDKIEYKDNKVIITRNPYGFISTDKESAVILDETGNLSDDEFIKQVLKILGDDTTHQSIKPTHYKLLPDSEDKFQEKYIEDGEMIERHAFQRRILGLTSYFNTHEFASENLPKYDKHRDLMIVRVPMSEYQTSEYEKEKEKREACNFVFPSSTTEQLNLSKDSLTTLSPKLLHLLENIEDGDGLHLVYSEVSCDIIKQILEKNGFSQLKLTGDEEEEEGKKRFIMFSDIKDEKEKEMTLNAYNGSAAKVFIISATDAEGISLKNTRFVHIVEPPESTTRIDQIVGRARRLCSHNDLPKELQTVNAYLYISTMNNDSTTIDEDIYETANKREIINKQVLQAIKETAIDCSLYSSKENVVCYDLGSKSMTSHHKKVTISGGMSYLVDKENNLHDIETSRFVGKLKRHDNGDKFRIE
jgi:hypothetical protein